MNSMHTTRSSTKLVIFLIIGSVKSYTGWGSSIKDVRRKGVGGVKLNADESGQGGRGGFSVSGRPHICHM